MTATETETISRAFPVADLELADGRTIVGRVVPYGEVGRVVDGAGDPYDEVWLAGSFRRVVRGAAAGRGPVLLNYEHRAELASQIGRAVELDDRDDGLWGAFRAFDTVPGDTALELVRCGAATGFSVQALVPKRRRIRDDGVVERHLATVLEAVALTGSPSFVGAGVTAVRSTGTPIVDEAPAVHLTEVRAWLDAARVRFPTS